MRSTRIREEGEATEKQRKKEMDTCSCDQNENQNNFARVEESEGDSGCQLLSLRLKECKYSQNDA